MSGSKHVVAIIFQMVTWWLIWVFWVVVTTALLGCSELLL